MPVLPGDRLPFCVGVGADQRVHSSDSQAGRAAVLVLAGRAPADAVMPCVEALADQRPIFARDQMDLLVMLSFAAGPGAWSNGPGVAQGVPMLLCPDPFFEACGVVDDAPLVLVIDRAARVVGRWRADAMPPASLVAAVLACCGGIGREEARLAVLPAPVLSLPGLFDADLCRRLINRFEAGAQFDSGISHAGAQGEAAYRMDADKKRRRDWLLDPRDDTHRLVLDLLGRRCVPAINQAFQHDISHTDRILVARYDAPAGTFRRHRDNTSPALAFRQFALSVNLNAGAYAGGHLLFPEFNDHHYRPATGEGVVFSASLLHEAAPVTEGRRYVLLTFLHDSKGEALRLAAGEAPVRSDVLL